MKIQKVWADSSLINLNTIRACSFYIHIFGLKIMNLVFFIVPTVLNRILMVSPRKKEQEQLINYFKYLIYS